MNFSRGRIFLASISFIVILSDVLTVALAGIPFNSAQSYTGYVISTFLSFSIIMLIIIALLVVLFRGEVPILPYGVDSVLSVLLYLCHSEMLPAFRELNMLDIETRNKRILDMGRRYKYGRVADLDGGVSFGIDFDTVW